MDGLSGRQSFLTVFQFLGVLVGSILGQVDTILFFLVPIGSILGQVNTIPFFFGSPWFDSGSSRH